MADTREESEPLLSRARGGSGRDCPRGVPACSSVQENPGEPRPGEGPGRAGAARRGPSGPSRAPAVAAGAPRLPRPGSDRALRRAGRLRPADLDPGLGMELGARGRWGEWWSRPAPPTGGTERPRSAREQPAPPRAPPPSPLRGLGASYFPWIVLVTPRRTYFHFLQFLSGKVRHREGRSPTQGHTARKWPR